jgi:hypothetical protein
MAHGGEQEVRLAFLLRQGHQETENVLIPCNAACEHLIGWRAPARLGLGEAGVSG